MDSKKAAEKSTVSTPETTPEMEPVNVNSPVAEEDAPGLEPDGVKTDEGSGVEQSSQENIPDSDQKDETIINDDGTNEKVPKDGTASTPETTTEAKQEPEAWPVNRVLKVGKPIVKGEDVRALQTALIANGFHCGAGGANGIYGKDTAHAVRMFQSRNRLIVDGRAGKFTVTKLGGCWEG